MEGFRRLLDQHAEAVRDARALAVGGLRVRGWTWLLSMLWVAAGAVITGYIFYSTTPNYISADIAGTGGSSGLTLVLRPCRSPRSWRLPCGWLSLSRC